jgi:hypothetical protein
MEDSRDEQARGAKAAQAREEIVGASDVASDLCAEFFRATELFFFTKALPEVDFDALWGIFLKGTENVSFDAKR